MLRIFAKLTENLNLIVKSDNSCYKIYKFHKI